MRITYEEIINNDLDNFSYSLFEFEEFAKKM